MKKSILYMCSAALMLVSCDLDINEDPNFPSGEDVTANLVFPSAQNFIAVTSCDNMFNYGGFFAQYFEQRPESNQFNSFAELNLTESDDAIGRAYYNLYAGALPDLQDVASKTTNKADLFAVSVLRAFCFQLMVDNCSEAPYSEALQGSANAQPKWDEGKAVYEGVLKEMDDAEAELDASNDVKMTVKDMMFAGNISQWKGYANALRLRMYLRMYDTDNSVQSKITALVNANNFFSGDVKLDIYQDNNGNRSPFYSSFYSLGTANHVPTYPLVSYLNATSDPRIEYAISKATGTGTYVGQIPGAKVDLKTWNGDWKNKDVSTINYELYNNTGAVRPAFLFTQAELQFFIAEVKLRFLSDDAGAKAAYNAAVAADFSARGMAGQETAFLTGASVNWDRATNKLKLIHMQKWVALFYMDCMEAWSEVRRTDIPEISSQNGYQVFKDPQTYTAGDLIINYRNSLIDSKSLMKRMYYPKTSRNLNPNTPDVKDGSVKIWWDVK